MDSGAFNTGVLHDIRQWLEEEKARHLEGIARIEALEQALANVVGNDPIQNAGAPDLEACPVAFVNGHKLFDKESQNFAEDKFDVILDMINRTLRFRLDPESHSELHPSPMERIGGHRVCVLAYMLQHPSWHFTAERVYAHFGETRSESENTFAKTISVLREALGTPGRMNPYILTVPAWDEGRNANSCIYTLNQDRQYLLVEASKEITGKAL
jgi:hypothetical protein